MNATVDPEAVGAVRAATRYALASQRGNHVPPPDLRLADSEPFLFAARRHRVEPLLLACADAVRLPSVIRTELENDVRQERLETLVAARNLLAVLAALRAAGIRALAVKGVALAVQTTGDFAARGVGDSDVWVHPADVEHAILVLTKNGYRQRVGETISPAPTWNWRYSHWLGFEIVLEKGDHLVDLHWRLSALASGLPDFDSAWRRRGTVRIGDVDVPTLSLADAFVHSCRHAQWDEWAWVRNLVDVYRLAERLAHPVPWPGGSYAAIARTLAITREQIGLPPNAPRTILSEGARRGVLAIAENQQLIIDPFTQRDYLSAGVRRIGVGLRTCRGASDVARVIGREILPVWTVSGRILGENPGIGKVAAMRIREVVGRLSR